MLKGNEGPGVVCFRCSNHVDTRCGGYWFLLLGPRGRCRFPGALAARSTLCSACGRMLREMLESQGFASAAYEVAKYRPERMRAAGIPHAAGS